MLTPVPSLSEQDDICDVLRSPDLRLQTETASHSALVSPEVRPHVRSPHRRTPRHPGPRTRMTPKIAGWDELHLSENPAVELLESLGYTYLPAEDLEPERTTFKEAILTGRLAAALKRLNPWLSETNIVTAIKAVTQVPATSLAQANEKLYTSLTYGIALEQDRGDGRKSHTVRFLDFDNPDRNEWIVTRQYRVLGSKKHVIPDIAIFVNGLPLAIIECKSPTKGDAWKSEAGPATPPLPGTRDALEGARGAEALRGGADPRRRPAVSARFTARSAPRSGSSWSGRSRTR